MFFETILRYSPGWHRLNIPYLLYDFLIVKNIFNKILNSENYVVFHKSSEPLLIIILNIINWINFPLQVDFFKVYFHIYNFTTDNFPIDMDGTVSRVYIILKVILSRNIMCDFRTQ